ncbi:hypothetical protein ACC811_37810, partial [Rhizobium ruizarguesonis]
MARLAGGGFDRFRNDNLAMPLSRMIAPREATRPRKRISASFRHICTGIVSPGKIGARKRAAMALK